MPQRTSTNRTWRRSNRAGLTFIDLAITVLILGILTAVAAPKFANAILRYRLRNGARQLIADVALARRHARATTSSETLTFSTSGDTYSFSSLKSFDHQSNLRKVELNESPFLTEIASADFNGNAAVTFNAYGIPSSGGTVEMNCGGYKIVVTVDAETGVATASDVNEIPPPEGMGSPPPKDPPPIPLK